MTQRKATNGGTRTATTLGLLLVVWAGVGLLAVPPAAFAQPAEHGGHSEHGGHAESQGAEDPHAHHKQMLGGRAEIEKVGQLTIPDLPVVTQGGDEVRFYSDLVEDRVVAMNFIFTTCRTICPPLGANFGKLQDLLGERVGRDVRLISVSVDPVTDTPERLKAWGELFGAGPGWTLVTGSKSEVTQLLKSLQVFTPDINDHSPVVLVGNAATGDWIRAYGLAPPKDLAALLESMTAEHRAHGGTK